MRRCLAPSGRVPFRPPTKSEVRTDAKQKESHLPKKPDTTTSECDVKDGLIDNIDPSGAVTKAEVCKEPRLKRNPLHSIHLHQNIPSRQAAGHAGPSESNKSHDSSYYTVLYTKRAPNKVHPRKIWLFPYFSSKHLAKSRVIAETQEQDLPRWCPRGKR
jgi:hypothetical protein